MQPSAGAMRAAREIRTRYVQTTNPPYTDQNIAEIIARETHAAQTLAALKIASRLLANCGILFDQELLDQITVAIAAAEKQTNP